MMSSIKNDISLVPELTESELQLAKTQVSDEEANKEPFQWADEAYKQRFVKALINTVDEEE